MNRSAQLYVPLIMRPLLVIATVSTSLLLAACGSSSQDASPPPIPASSSASSGGVLPEGKPYTVSGYKFSPLTVAPGQVVEVVDGDGEPHTLRATDGSFDTGSFDASTPGTFTAPDKPGTYEFTCEIHPSMTGTLTVQQ